MSDYRPTERIVRRGAKLWRRAMEAPVFDQLGPDRERYSLTERLGEALGQAVVTKAREGATDEQLDRFEAELARLLLAPREDWPASLTGGRAEVLRVGFEWSLFSDYNPPPSLGEACRVADLSPRLVPIKSSMALYEDYLTVSFGYGAPVERHLPLPDGLWVVTRLGFPYPGPELARLSALALAFHAGEVQAPESLELPWRVEAS